jgi:hypothetical protein
VTHWQHPRFFAYFPANTSFESILGDMWAGALSNPGFNVRIGFFHSHFYAADGDRNAKWACSPISSALGDLNRDGNVHSHPLQPSWK